MKLRNFVFIVAILAPLSSYCSDYYDIVYNGIYYKLNKSLKEATVVMGSEETGRESPVFNPTYQGDVVIPEKFSYEGVPYTVTSIGGNVQTLQGIRAYGAFQGCVNMTSITIPKSVKNIGTLAFKDCTSLNSVYINDLSSWCNINFDVYDSYRYGYTPSTNPLYYAHNLYVNGKLITKLIIPEDVLSIKTGSFIGGNFLSVVLHKNISSIKLYAFDECDYLNEYYVLSPSVDREMPSTWENGDDTNKVLHIRERYLDNYIKWWVWAGFGKIEYIIGVDYYLYFMVDNVEYKKTIYEIGESITAEETPQKEGYTFSGWSEIPDIMPNHDVTVTGSFIPNFYKLIYKVDGEEYKIVEVKCDEAITIEANPTKKGMTFSGWSEIPEKMPAHDVEVTGTFSWSKKTVDGVIYQVTDADKETAAVIGNNNTTGTVTIAPTVDFDYTYSVTAINDKAFYGRASIISIEIPATVTSIGERAFANIDKLTDVTILAENIPETDRTAFENSYIEDYVTLHVPEAALEKYSTTAPWKNFKEVVGIAGPKKCATPTIIYEDGKIKFACETEGVTFKYQVTNADIKEAEGAEIEVGGVYTVSVYATKEDYIDSETATKQISIIPKKGDLNNDGEVNVADHVVLSGIIMEQSKQNVE